MPDSTTAKTTPNTGLITGVIEAALGGTPSTVVSGVLSFFSTTLLGVTEDELVILGNAIAKLYDDLHKGTDFETAFTDCLNEFYNEERGEGAKICAAVAESIGKVMTVLRSL